MEGEKNPDPAGDWTPGPLISGLGNYHLRHTGLLVGSRVISTSHDCSPIHVSQRPMFITKYLILVKTGAILDAILDLEVFATKF